MDRSSPGRPTREEILALLNLVGVEPREEGPHAVVPQAIRVHQGALRLRELDLSGVDPVTVFRPAGR